MRFERSVGIEKLVDIVLGGDAERWTERNESAFDSLFGDPDGRYPKAARKDSALRAPAMPVDEGIRFGAYIHPSNATSGAYGGLSFVIFPATDAPCLVALVVGTQGLTPDQQILGRPGHARKSRAICEWLNALANRQVAWYKHDPTQTDIFVPDTVQQRWPEYKRALDRYKREIYACFKPPASDPDLAYKGVVALLDLYMSERGHKPLSRFTGESTAIEQGWLAQVTPSASSKQVVSLLQSRRFGVLQGPPGTGKTRMALQILEQDYAGRGFAIQCHASTTYEDIIGGLAPIPSASDLGLRFAPKRGALMKAAARANESSENVLLVLDEINRTDLAKVLGEGLFLLEPHERSRTIDLAYDFGEPWFNKFSLPENLHILGTMNSADRSIGIVDIAVRRRFAFVSLWPSIDVVLANACDTMQNAFQKLFWIFLEHATNETFSMMPGHSYFLEKDEVKAKTRLATELAPLLNEYLAQGYVSGFAEEIRAYLQWLQDPEGL